MSRERPPRPPHAELAALGPGFSGPTSFQRVPVLAEPEELDRWQVDVAIVGAPWDDSVTYRPGARFAPRAVRTANYQDAEWHLDLKVAPLEVLSVVDFGDAFCPPGLVDASHEAIRERVFEVASRRILPAVIGGDHSITYPSATAVADAYGRGRVGLVHFDAHADTGEDAWGFLKSHGSPMRLLVTSGAIPGQNFAQIGLRGYWPPPEVFDWMREQGIHSHLMSEVHEKGIEAMVDIALSEVREHAEHIYLSVDIDVLDPGFAPGTGTPEPGGMTPADLLTAIRRVTLEADVVAMDVVEVSPPYDHAELAAQNANRCLLEMISALAVKRSR